MEEIFLALQEKIATEVIELTLVDMDWGQLETEEETYPVTFPCCLIDVPETEYKKTGISQQPGVTTVRVKVAVDMLHDTHNTSETAQSAISRLAVAKSVHEAINLFTSEGFSKLIRARTRRYNLPGAIKVTEFEYETGVFE
jgi:hypothetical protein